jgi:O-acetyl-ADP-ribose deacetylase (regulator of RNase III)
VRIEVSPGDITVQQVDVIVNAANPSLLGGGGVDGAIHAAAGPGLLEECRRVRRSVLPDGLPIGQAVATGAGNLAARWVVHTVGPNWHRGQRDPDLLASCFRNSLILAAELGARSAAFPAISAGSYGWDVERVADLGVGAVRAADAEGRAGAVVLVRFVPFGPAATAAFEHAARAAVAED